MVLPCTTAAGGKASTGPAISDQALLVAIEADLEASPWEGEGYRKVGLGFGSVATSGLPASGCSA